MAYPPIMVRLVQAGMIDSNIDLFGNNTAIQVDSRFEKIKLIKSKIQAGKNSTHLKSVNSLSGGRTSSMLEVLHPADYSVFAVVTTDYPQYHIKDPGIRRFTQEKLSADYYATLESDETLRSVMELEQYTGRPIHWVAGKSLDSLIDQKQSLPNPTEGWCTTHMKIEPMFMFLMYEMGWTKYIEKGEQIPESKYVRMNIGYRIDDIERVARFTESFKYAWGNSKNGRKKWKEFTYRIGNFPVIDKTQREVIDFWKGKPVRFPELNNCEFCHKRPVSLIQKMFRDYPQKAEFWIEMERITGRRFRMDYSLEEIKKLPLSETIDFTAVSLCNTGGCTD